MSKKTEAVIVAYGRSACCRARKGGLAHTHPVEYGAQVLRGVLGKVPQLQAEHIDDVIVGCAMPVGPMDRNAARLITLRAGLPYSVCAHTLNRFCSSSLQAIATGANAILAGQMDCVVAGGVEAMSLCFGDYPEEYQDPWIVENCPGGYMSMGETAERVAERYDISRIDMEKMAVESHRKAALAQKNGKLAPSILPVTNADGQVLTLDEGIRPDTSLETLAGLKPCFRPEGRVTAATSSQTTDAAAFAVIMSAELAEQMGIVPIARFVGFAVAGCDPTVMGLGPIYAVPKVLSRAGLSLKDMDVIELNEAFAAQSIACIRELNLPEEKVNPYGGAMALGHPMGATGVFLTGKALDYLKDTGGKYALVTMCIGGGMGAAGIFELLR